MLPFAGWNMPIQYTGIIAEHNHTRSKASLFDTSHMGELYLRGRGALSDLDRLITCRVDNLAIGAARYGLLLNESGGILEDLIVYRTAQNEYLLVVNAATTARDIEWIESQITAETQLADESERSIMLSLQGPRSRAILSEHANDLEDLNRFALARTDLHGTEVLIARTGYTGELGFELIAASGDAEKLWDLLVSHPDVMPAGLGARDTLRLEMGYPLYGNDIDETRTPIEANLQRFVYRGKEFMGREGLLANSQPSHVLTGFICDGRRSARSHFDVIIDERGIGTVTSGAFSPTLKRGIGLCYIERSLAVEGKKILLKGGDTTIKAKIATPPLLP
jgi:aminomethyltransferase